MIDCRSTGSDSFAFEIDRTIYSDAVIAKTLYWFAADYIIFRQGTSPGRERIRCVRKDGSPINFDREQAKLSDALADFRTREIIARESAAIRNILYLKAFASEDLPEAPE